MLRHVARVGPHGVKHQRTARPLRLVVSGAMPGPAMMERAAALRHHHRHDFRLDAFARRRETHVFLVFLRPVELASSEEHTSELQSLMRISYAVFCLTQ